jgi:DNA-dependent RNA polymerase auxiliary subunit epsilon
MVFGGWHCISCFWVCDCILNVFDGWHWILLCNYCFWRVTLGTHHSIYNTMSPSKNNNYKIEFSVIHQKHLIYSRTPKKHEIHCHPPKTIKYTLTGTHHSIYNTMSPSKNNNYKIEFSVIHQKHLIYSRTPKSISCFWVCDCILNVFDGWHWILLCNYCFWRVTLYCILNGVCPPKTIIT